MPKKLTLPLSDEDIKNLKAGESVLLSGTMLTGRDAAHKRLFELIEKGENLPVDIKGEIIYYVGPCLLYTSPSPRDRQKSRMPSSA